MNPIAKYPHNTYRLFKSRQSLILKTERTFMQRTLTGHAFTFNATTFAVAIFIFKHLYGFYSSHPKGGANTEELPIITQ